MTLASVEFSHLSLYWLYHHVEIRTWFKVTLLNNLFQRSLLILLKSGVCYYCCHYFMLCSCCCFPGDCYLELLRQFPHERNLKHGVCYRDMSLGVCLNRLVTWTETTLCLSSTWRCPLRGHGPQFENCSRLLATVVWAHIFALCCNLLWMA